MYSLTTAFITLCAILPTALATPTQPNGTVTTALERRVTYTGEGTWYDNAITAGACGYQDLTSDATVAISTSLYGSGGYCDRYIQVTNTNTGQSATGLIRDECPFCNTYDLDMSPGLFEQLSTLSDGEIPISWQFI
ncbi:barwin-like endoglucanase [Rhizopogon vinicolor AM-OR11-026]|uniref:Barwin-like endoglucanase n=1 Tax=Rhizopogon vinicolor AM-OR11-026 TaxID=1314800 RepID=A0A1B7N3K5_9AGAM|nr:barwin-like endoglucanase [Rhizopogon vinicolor AM-OR11-026]